MITVNLQSGGTYSIEENIVANIKSNSGGSEIVVVEAEQLRSIFSSQSPATVAGLSPYFLSLTNIQRAEVVATIGYSGLSNTIDFLFNIGAGRWSKLTDNGTNSLTAVAQLVQNITVGQAITSDTGFAKVSSVSYTYPSNTIYLNALRIKDVTALGFYGGSLVKYDEGGADFAEYEVGIAPATLVTQINAIGGGGSGWGLSGNAGTDGTTNFIGTTDDEPLVLRSNNAALLEINESTSAFIVSSYDQLLDPALQSGVEVAATNGGSNLRLRCKVNDVPTANIDISDTISFSTNEIERVIIDNDGNVGIGTNTPASLLTVDDGDIEVTNKNNGLILYSQDGTKYRITAADGGTLTVTAI